MQDPEKWPEVRIAVVFGSQCTFWTDRADLIMTCSGGHMHCPHCDCQLKLADKETYLQGMTDYQRQHPADKEWPSMWIWAKDGKCFESVDKMRAAYRKALKRKN